MARFAALCAIILGGLTAGGAPADAADPKLVTLTTPRGAKQSFILMQPTKPPVAAVILFAGGHGALGLKSATGMAWGAGNFLVRTRDKFVGHDLLVAVADAPSDKQDGMNAVFRMSGDHARDIAAIVAHLKKEANVPVWVVGTSMGTFSAAGAAVNGAGADGLVLTSTITRAKSNWNIADSHADGVASMALGRVTVPTLIVSHKKDGCDITPARDAPKLAKKLSKAKKVETVILEGGSPPESDPCQARSEHGFLGIEDKAVSSIAAYIKENGK